MNAPASGLFAARSDALERWIQLGVASGRMIHVSFVDADPGADGDDHPVLERLLAYADAGAVDDFRDVPIGLTVATDVRRVLETVRDIPYGDQWPLARIVERTPAMAGDEDAAIAALAENPVPVLVPDHRVDGATGATPPAVRDALRAREGID